MEKQFREFYNPGHTVWMLWSSDHDRRDTYVKGKYKTHAGVHSLAVGYDQKDGLIFKSQRDAILYYLRNEAHWSFSFCAIKVDQQGNMLDKCNILETIMNPRLSYRQPIIYAIQNSNRGIPFWEDKPNEDTC